MAPLKQKGDIAELRVALDLRRRGYVISIPFGEDADYDLIAERKDGRLERVQVKYTESNGEVITVRTRSHSLTNGRVRRVKKYTAKMIDWLAVYDLGTDCCYYIAAAELGSGMNMLHLRIAPTRNNQGVGIRFAKDYLEMSR